MPDVTLRVRAEFDSTLEKRLDTLARKAEQLNTKSVGFTTKGQLDKAAAYKEASEKASEKRLELLDTAYLKFTQSNSEQKLRILNNEHQMIRRLFADNKDKLLAADQAYARAKDAIERPSGKMQSAAQDMNAKYAASREKASRDVGRMYSQAYGMNYGVDKKRKGDEDAAYAEEERRNSKKQENIQATGRLQVQAKELDDKYAASRAKSARDEGKMYADAYYMDSQYERKKGVTQSRALDDNKKIDAKQVAQAEKTRSQIAALNAGALKQGESEQAAYWMAQMRQEGRGGGASAAGGGSMFGGMGQKRLMRQMIGFEAGQAIGGSGMGQEVGLIAGGFLYGSPALGGVMAAAVMLGAYFRQAKEGADEARKSMETYTNALTETTGKWSHMASSMIKTSPFGGELAGMVGEQGKGISAILGGQAARAVKETWVDRTMQGLEAIGHGMDATKQGWSWLNPFQASARGQAAGYGSTGKGRAESAEAAEIAMRRQQQLFALKHEPEEYAKEVQDQKALNGLKIDAMHVDTMRSGLGRDRARLTQEEKAGATKLAIEQENDTRHAKLEVEQTELLFAAAQKANSELRKNEGTTPEEMAASDQKKEDALLARNAARTALSRLPAQQTAENEQQKNENAEKEAIFEARSAERLEEITFQTEESKIKATMEGEEQRKALRNAAFERELGEAGTQAEKIALVARHLQDTLADIHTQGLGRRKALATFVPAAAVEEFRQEMANFGKGPETEQIAREKLVGSYERERHESEIQRAVDQKRLSERKADIARKILANPFAQAGGPEGDQVRAAILADVNAKHYNNTGEGQFYSDSVQRWEHDQSAILQAADQAPATSNDIADLKAAIVDCLTHHGILLGT